MNQNKQPHAIWINCARATAIFGVMVFHAGDKLAIPALATRMSLYCVVLFLLLGGCTTRLSLSRHAGENYLSYCKRRLPPLVVPYLALCCCYQFAKYKRFVLPDMLRAIVAFSYEEHLYYIFVYLQLLLLAPLLLRLLTACSRARRPRAAHALAFLCVAAFSAASMRFTYLLPLSGNGAYLFGGSFLPCFYAGMLLTHCEWFPFPTRPRPRAALGCGALLLWLMLVLFENRLAGFSPAFLFSYAEFNPPGALVLLQGLLMFCACYGIFGALADLCAARPIVRFLDFIGRYTLYIYLYMLLIRAFIYGRVPVENVHLLRLITFAAMLLLPIAGKLLWNFAYARVRRFLGGGRDDLTPKMD